MISKPFYLGKYEVTQKEWVEVIGRGIEAVLAHRANKF
jgi:formylglycine-generating enzyme required for sulfatase activity